MRISNDSFFYDYNVKTPNIFATTISSDDFTIDFLYRNSNESDTRKSFQISFTNREQFSTIMSELLEQHDVPNNLIRDFAQNFRFNLERLVRLRRGGVTIPVTLKVTAIPEGAERMISRMRERENNVVVRRVVEDTVEMIPARKSAVTELERGIINEDKGDEECSICLGTYEKGVEIIKMPCHHFYHTVCILRWLHKNHFCPFCRFELPC